MMLLVAAHMEGMPSHSAWQPFAPERTALGVLGGGPRVVIADGDENRRAALLERLTDVLPEGTVFIEAATAAEALERARGSRMLVVGEGFGDASAGHLARIVGRRYPDLHVIDARRSRGMVG
jgi:hypothetical protein